MSTPPPTPELEKVRQLDKSGARGAVQDFIDWLAAQGYVLHEWRTDLTDWRPCDGGLRSTGCKGAACTVCGGARGWEVSVSPQYLPVTKSPEVLMAEHFGVDLNKMETEKRALLDHLRESP